MKIVFHLNTEALTSRLSATLWDNGEKTVRMSMTKKQNETKKPQTLRKSGILLHPTSLPGGYGIGSFGETAHAWIQRLARSGQGVWQMLPLGPTGFGDSPYQCYSAFAGNPLLIDLEALRKKGWIQENLADHDDFNPVEVEYEKVRAAKMPLLRDAFAGFRKFATRAELEAFEAFCRRESYWLEDFALFMALKRHHRGAPWYEWPQEHRRREPEALRRVAEALEQEVVYRKFLQYIFDVQWKEVKRHADDSGIETVGDLPIYVALDSADVWARPELFELDEALRPRRVAGVPPDYFSPTGQRWGNPLYDWKRMEKEGYEWWIRRFAKSFELYDRVRIDHFRGFAAYWAIPAEEETANRGEWVEGPGRRLFEAARVALGELPILAEDLGIITPDVQKLRDDLGFPGMKILQFAFDGSATNPYLTHNHVPNCVVYTGTHDNDTTLGWYEKLEDRSGVDAYLNPGNEPIHWAAIREIFRSVANMAIFPMQDMLGLGSWARMNRPGEQGGNWRWRMSREQMEEAEWDRLRSLSELYGRIS